MSNEPSTSSTPRTRQQLSCSFRPHLDPRGLDVGHVRVQRQARNRMRQEALPQSGAPAGTAPEVQRRLHVHKGQRHKLGDAAAAFLQVSQGCQVAGPVCWGVHVPKHECGCGGQANCSSTRRE